ncbi:MAG: pyridoxal-phosphate dependent enzyme [Chitinophagales bacterium]|nr:pyridoxal-phosphate dependent enzyme [Chitinophagales bacterium]
MSSDLTTLFQHAPSPLQRLKHPIPEKEDISLWIKRDDLLQMGPEQALCGNKWRKLQYNLQAAREAGHDTLLTFGGAYSNHIAAVAAAGSVFGFQTIGCIRGEEHLPLNATLSFARAYGMEIHYINRSDYREKHTSVFQQQLRKKHGNFYLIPEGGTNHLAIKGCENIPIEVEQQLGRVPDYYCSAVGTGGTLSGIIAGANNHESKVIGYPALKGNFLGKEVSAFLKDYLGKVSLNWQINTDYHFGGYAKFTPELIQFINRFKADTEIQLEPIYTGKLLFGVLDMIAKGYFEKGSTVVIVHSGGLQGIKGFNERFGELLN